VTQSVIARGADVIFGMGDGASFGYLQAIETAKAGHKVWFIDVIGNKTAIDKKHVLLSSVIWDFTQVFKQAIRAIDNGTFGTKPYFLTVRNGISLLHSRYISNPVWRLIERKRTLIGRGKIKIPLTPTRAAVNRILRSK
jgi:basic membrane protein A and related proteins